MDLRRLQSVRIAVIAGGNDVGKQPCSLVCGLRHRWAFLLLVIVSAPCGCSEQKPVGYHIVADYSVHGPQFAQVMGNLLGPPLIPGNSCVSLLNGDQIFPSMLAAIRSA